MFRLIKKKKHVYFIVYFIIFILIERPSYAPPPTPAPATVSKQFYKPLTLYYQQDLKSRRSGYSETIVSSSVYDFIRVLKWLL